jgi:methionine-rich copper-binding protein CopC
MPQIASSLAHRAAHYRLANARGNASARSVGRRITAVASFVGAVLSVAWTPVGAWAHAIVVRTSPAQSGVAPGEIGKVDVWYDAGIRDAFAALAVVSASGERVDKRDAAIDSSDPSHVSVSVNALTPGKYTVRYRALSADGHLVSGTWEFEVK